MSGPRNVPNHPQAAYVEILESIPREPDGAVGPGIMRANQIRINGVPILCPKGESIHVHGVTLGAGDDDDLVKVTVTMWARRVVMEQRDSRLPLDVDQPT